MLCCSRKKEQKGWVTVLVGSNLQAISQEVRSSNKNVVGLSMNSIYPFGEVIPGDLKFLSREERLHHTMLQATNLAGQQTPAVVEVSARDMYTVLDNSEYQQPHTVVLAHVPMEKLVGFLKSSVTPNALVNELIDYSLLYRGSPQKTSSSLQFIKPSTIDYAMSQLEKTLGGTAEAREAALPVRRALCTNLGLNQNAKGVYIQPRYELALAVDATNAYKAAKKILSHSSQLRIPSSSTNTVGGSNNANVDPSQPWSDVDYHGTFDTLTGVRVWHQNHINGVQFRYGDAWAPARGRQVGRQEEYLLPSGHFVTRVSGRSGECLNMLSFHGSDGSSSAKFGGDGGKPFNLQASTGDVVTNIAGNSEKSGQFLQDLKVTFGKHFTL